MKIDRAALFRPLIPAIMLLLYAFAGWGSHPLLVSLPVTLALVLWTLFAAVCTLPRPPGGS